MRFADHGGAWGNASSSTYKDDSNNDYTFDGLYMEPRLGPINAYMSSLGANVPQWTPDCLINGCCWSYIKYTYDVKKYPNGNPNPRATIWGKNTIYDPRTGTTGWSNNAALCIADFLCDPIYGFGFNMQEDIDLDQLAAAANICDEQVPLAAGGTESRYTINGAFDASTAPGDVLASMLDACGGRISTAGGKVKIYPAAWVGPSLAFDAGDLADSVAWSPTRKFRDLINCVKGTYIAPNYPYSVSGNYYGSNGKDANGGTQSNFQYEWQPTDFPAYMQDADHGYAVNQPLLNANGVELWSDLRLQFVTSAATAQRLAKIKMMRNQQQGSGTLPFNLSAYRCQPMDVIQFTFTPLQMTDQALEVSDLRLAQKQDGNGTLCYHVELDVQQTDISVYSWSTAEEMTPSGSTSPQRYDPGFVSTPVSPSITDNLTTAYVGPDGVVQPRLNVAWTLPTDGSSAYWSGVQVQYQLNGWNAWQDAGTVAPDNFSTLISGVVAGQQYNVRVRAVKPSGATSAWVVAGTHTVSSTYSQVNSKGIAPGLIAASVNNATIDSVVASGHATVRVYGAGGVGTGYTQAIGSTMLTLPAASITGQAFSTTYSLLWNTSSSSYLLTTGASPSDSYVLIGTVTTVASGGTGGTAGGGGGGVYACTIRGTKLQSDRGEESNEVIKDRFDSGEPTFLMGRNGPERIVSAEWVSVDHYQWIEVDGCRPFGCSDTHTLLPEGSDRHVWCSCIELGTRVATTNGYAVMHRSRVDSPAEVQDRTRGSIPRVHR